MASLQMRSKMSVHKLTTSVLIIRRFDPRTCKSLFAPCASCCMRAGVLRAPFRSIRSRAIDTVLNGAVSKMLAEDIVNRSFRIVVLVLTLVWRDAQSVARYLQDTLGPAVVLDDDDSRLCVSDYFVSRGISNKQRVDLRPIPEVFRHENRSKTRCFFFFFFRSNTRK